MRRSMKNINRPSQKENIIVIRQKVEEWVFPSTSGYREWTVKYHKGMLSCNCPSAIYKMCNEDRICKHIDYLLKQGIPLFKEIHDAFNRY